jgi:CheY-like chemotaxis protein
MPLTNGVSREFSRRVDRTCVLLVEDDDDIRDTLAEILSQEGYSVLAARHGREALELLARVPRPRLILLDLRMPVMDGVQFRRHQLRDHRLREVPVVVLTAALDDRSDEVLAGCGQLRKPVDLDALLATVAAACRIPEMGAQP